jgi:hypothetical protein
MSARDEEHRVAIRNCFGGDLGADDAVGAGAILEDELLLERLREALADDARERVCIAARCVTYNHTHWCSG